MNSTSHKLSLPDPIVENEKLLTENDELLSEIKLKVIQNEIRNVMHKIDLDVADCGSIRSDYKFKNIYLIRELGNLSVLYRFITTLMT